MTASAESARAPGLPRVASKKIWPWLLMALALLASVLVALCVGRYPLSLSQVSGVLAAKLLPDGLGDRGDGQVFAAYRAVDDHLQALDRGEGIDAAPVTAGSVVVEDQHPTLSPLSTALRDCLTLAANFLR